MFVDRKHLQINKENIRRMLDFIFFKKVSPDTVLKLYIYY